VKTNLKQLKKIVRLRMTKVIVFALILAPVSAQAAGLAPRSIQVGSSGPGANTSYTVNVTTATLATVGSIGFDICTTPTGACSVPSGVTTTSATLTSQSGATGFSIITTTNGFPYMNRAAGVINAGVELSYTLGNITNPSSANTTYYVRVTTYSGTDGATGPVDTGTVALSTAQPVLLTGVTPEILVFCVGTSISGNCSTISGSTLDFGDFSPVASNYGTSVMQAQTNASSGYAITVNGTTLASGANTIPALATQTSSAVRTNTVPTIGSDPTGTGSGIDDPNYSTTNQYRFDSGDVVATAANPTDANTFTSSYVVNIGGAQAAGVYTATMTYICTASF
jgi:hypothetical protein